MSLSLSESREFDDLLDIFAEDELSATESVRFNELLGTSDDARRIYLAYFALHSALEWDLADRPVFSPSGAPPERSTDGSSTLNSTVSHVAASPVLSFVGRLRLTPRLIGLAASVVLVGYFIALAGLVIWDHSRRAERHERVGSAATDSFAKLTQADDADWEQTPSVAAENVRSDRTLRVHTGFAELKFSQGAKVVVQGPAEFEICSANRGFLRRGKLVATVPKQAIGFIIDTPTAEIIDLGTEFGVEVDDQQNAEVHVFKGVVEARQLNALLAQNDAVRVTAGNALRIDSQQLQPVPIAIQSKQQFGFAKQTESKRIDRDMLVAEWDFLQDQNLTFAANGASRVAKLSGRGTFDRGVALEALSDNRQLRNGFLSALRVNDGPNDEGLITEARWEQFFGTEDLTPGSFVVVFKPKPTQWVRYVLFSHKVQGGEFGQLFASFEQNSTNTTSEVKLRVGPNEAEATMNVPSLKNTDWYFLGGSWAPDKKNFLYLRNITDGTLCGTAIGNVPVKMHQGVMKKPIHLGLRNSYDNTLDEWKLSESANSLFAYAALLYPYWNTTEQFDQFYSALVNRPEKEEAKNER